MEIKYYPTAGEFLSHVGGYLAEDEARYGLILGIARRLTENVRTYGEPGPWFCSAGSDACLQAVAIRTPPFSVVLAHFSGEPAALAGTLAATISEKEPAIPGAMGDRELADKFAAAWCREKRVTVRGRMAERLYRLEKIDKISLARGRLRPAAEKDIKLVQAWARAFNGETFGESLKQPETDMTPLVTGGNLFLWEDGAPVSMAARLRPTDSGMSVGYVYTPPEFRRRGYATSCVAGLCRNILQSGKEFCMLYADLANPVSNSIYKKIGFREVCDSVMYSFEKPEV
jgi:RimJ/RimL family protein N-acetyltransferase